LDKDDIATEGYHFEAKKPVGVPSLKLHKAKKNKDNSLSAKPRDLTAVLNWEELGHPR
jgi:hypothetical protein